MRSEWVSVSAAALVTGVMALVLAQTLNPAGTETSPAAQLVIAAESPGRWMAMSVLFFLGAAAIVLGVPSIMTLFQTRRGRGLATAGVALLTVGSVGLGGLSGLMLMFRSIARQVMASPLPQAEVTGAVSEAVADPALMACLSATVYTFLLGTLLVAIALFRARTAPRWVPGILMAFLAVQLTMPMFGEGPSARVASSIALVLFAGGFTGIATHSVGLGVTRGVTHSWALNSPS